MIKILKVGDPHIKGTNPRNRTDNYLEAVVLKIREIFTIARQHGVNAMIWTGDTFDSLVVSNGLVQDTADLLDESPCMIFTTTGSHDIDGYNLNTYRRTSLALLERMSKKLKVVIDPTQGIPVESDAVKVALTFQPHIPPVDIDGYGYNPAVNVPEDMFNIHTVHGMLLDHVPPFDKYTLIDNAETSADLVVTGHYHPGYGIIKRTDGKTFINLGSLTRKSASEADITRDIQVGLITIRSKHDFDIDVIKLKTAKPGDKVLDRSKIEAEKARDYAMTEFAALIQSKTGEKVLLDVDTIVQTIADQEGVEPEVVTKALEKINEQRGRV